MSAEALEYIKNMLASLGIHYALYEWKGAPAGKETCYFVGDYTEEPVPNTHESGISKAVFRLRGFTRGTALMLEEKKEIIRRALPKTAMLAGGGGIAVEYSSAFSVPTGEMALKSLNMTLQVTEWRV